MTRRNGRDFEILIVKVGFCQIEFFMVKLQKYIETLVFVGAMSVYPAYSIHVLLLPKYLLRKKADRHKSRTRNTISHFAKKK